MGRRSHFYNLPKEVQIETNRRLEAGFTLDDVMAYIEEQGCSHIVSRSGLGRYAFNEANLAADLTKTRIMAESLGRQLDDASDDNNIGRVALEMLQSITMKTLAASLSGRNADLSPQENAYLAKSLKDVMSASEIDGRRRAKIKAEARIEALREAAESVESMAGARGLTAETVKAVQDKIMGI